MVDAMAQAFPAGQSLIAPSHCYEGPVVPNRMQREDRIQGLFCGSPYGSGCVPGRARPRAPSPEPHSATSREL